MARLIDADKLRECYESWGYDLSKCVVPVTIVRQNIEDMPTVDAVEVVRCKDCKHFNSFNEQCEKSSFYGRTMGEDGYCSLGERKEK